MLSTSASTAATARRPGLILAICCLSLLMVGVDNTIVTIALPAIRADLRAGLPAAQWTVDSYQLVLGALLLTAGAVADAWGRRRTLQLGISVFTAASVLCAFAPTAGWLIGFRVMQAIGGSMMNPVAMAIVTHAYPDRHRRAHAFGIWSGVYGLSMALGPVLGGSLVQLVGWRSIFWVNVPIGIAAVALCAWAVPESKSERTRRFDAIGQLLIVLALALFIFAIIEGGTLGWGSPQLLMLLVLSAAAAVVFVWWERRASDPVIDLAFFRDRSFSGALVIALVGMGAAAGYLWVTAFYLQESRGFPPGAAGLLLLPVAVLVMVAAPVSGRLTARYGPGLPLMVSGAAIAIAALLFARLERDTSAGVVLLSFVVFGIGFGMLNAPVTTAAVSGMPESRAGVASAVASTGRQVGQALGVAVVGAVVASRTTGSVSDSLPSASHAGWWVIAAGGATVFLVALGVGGRRVPGMRVRI